MKNKYIKPEIQVVEVELQMMAASLGENELGLNNVDATGDALSKGHDGNFDVWGLDEE
ncbi:MAG: hypothetical protein PUD88_02710 [Prevotellaceae bacterium]|nr:hypothetical protein [Prevotella sp.]MDD6817474.1 hypothetical protein [Prevotellaceae bacterium]